MRQGVDFRRSFSTLHIYDGLGLQYSVPSRVIKGIVAFTCISLKTGAEVSRYITYRDTSPTDSAAFHLTSMLQNFPNMQQQFQIGDTCLNYIVSSVA